jgi:hypothetical protein
MLRDWICSADRIATWPCDEINYIWRHGNLSFPSDAFTPEMAAPAIRKYIRARFSWVARRYGAKWVVEKTCANSLRVGFVARTLESPKFLFIFRDGLDAVGSAMRRWTAPLDILYVLRKARFVPSMDLPYYAARYLRSRLSRFFHPAGQLSSWGPVLPDMKRIVAEHTLPEICAMQWKSCVDHAMNAQQLLPPEQCLSLRYEDLVRAPSQSGLRIAEFLGVDQDLFIESPFINRINAKSVGRAKSSLPLEVADRVSEIIAPTMRRLGYQ